jgi:hypothetical protein
MTIFAGFLVIINLVLNEEHDTNVNGALNDINDNGRLFCVFTVHLTTLSVQRRMMG